MGTPGKRTPAGEVEAMIRRRMAGASVRVVAREFYVDTKTVMRCAPLRVVAARIAIEQLRKENFGSR
jgi:hypothetical protein